MKAPRHKILVSSFLLTFLLVGGAATTSFGGVIVKCSTSTSTASKVCIIKTKKGRKGDQVVVKDRSQNLYWKASGTIVRNRGEYSVVVFSCKEDIARGDIAEVQSDADAPVLDWKSSFSNRDLEFL